MQFNKITPWVIRYMSQCCSFSANVLFLIELFLTDSKMWFMWSSALTMLLLRGSRQWKCSEVWLMASLSAATSSVCLMFLAFSASTSSSPQRSELRVDFLCRLCLRTTWTMTHAYEWAWIHILYIANKVSQNVGITDNDPRCSQPCWGWCGGNGSCRSWAEPALPGCRQDACVCVHPGFPETEILPDAQPRPAPPPRPLVDWADLREC